MMKHVPVKLNRRLSAAVQQTDLDVTPVMNLFIILVPFLISMVVFTHLASLRFSLPSNAGSAPSLPGERPKLKLTVVIAERYLTITRGGSMLDSIGLANGFPYAGDLSRRLQYHRAACTDAPDEAVVAVRDGVAFQNVVTVMDIMRTTGFSKIGISGAAGDPATGM